MRALIFDTETTALISNSLLAEKHQPQVIEFYGALFEGEEQVGELEFFCDPGKPLLEEITRITGIRPDQVAGQPSFGYYSEAVTQMIESADRVVAHNLSYDMAVINFELRRLGESVQWPADKVCTVESTEHLKGHRLNLSSLHELLFGVPFSGAHRARADVEALARCYHELVRRGEI